MRKHRKPLVAYKKLEESLKSLQDKIDILHVAMRANTRHRITLTITISIVYDVVRAVLQLIFS